MFEKINREYGIEINTLVDGLIFGKSDCKKISLINFFKLFLFKRQII